MRFRYVLPAALLTAGSAFAQAGAAVPNAVGLWNSSLFGFFGWFIGTGFPAGTAGNQMWQSLPPELTTYHRNGSALRQLDVRGFEMNVTHFTAGGGLYDTPRMQVRNAIPGFAGGTRWTPGATVYADLASIPLGINAVGTAAGTTFRVSMDLGAGGAVAVPTAPGGSGDAILAVWQDFQKQLGDGFGLYAVASSTEPTAGIAGTSYSGGSTNAGQNFILPNVPFSGEWVWTWLLEQSMIQPVVNAEFISSTGNILGGGAPPVPFAVKMDDGRHGIYPVAGDAVSYNGNSTYGNPAPAAIGTTWFAPFVQFSGDVAAPGITDPLPEIWQSGPMYIYASPVAKYIDDICVLTGGCLPGQGAILNPAGSFHGLWLGTDLPFLINITLLLNGLVFADVSSGFQWAGPSTMMYDSALNPGSLIGRNLANITGYVAANGAVLTGVREHRTLLAGPQSGYTPVSNAAPSPTLLGFGVYPGALAGQTFAIQCWLLDMNILQIVDVSNVAVTRLQ